MQVKDPKFNSVLDIAGKSKLFSIVVDTLDTAQKILEINKHLKGGVINIFPLESAHLVKQKLAALHRPPASEAKPISDFVCLKENADKKLQGLVHNMLYKVYMVRDYNTAMQIAKDYNLTCVTPDLQVVYAGAFITKVGAQ